MSSDLPYYEEVAQRLPLPLAQLYRRAHNAKSALEGRRFLILTLVTFALLGCVGCSGQSSRSAAPTRETGGVGRALLVGCTKYEHAEKHSLAGAANDLPLLRDVLVRRFGFEPARITTLAEDQGKKELRPTRENTMREFDRLAREARPGEQVVVYLAGHGSQVENQMQGDPELDLGNDDDDEPDGYDEVFCPADARLNKFGKFVGFIRDDELRKALQAIVDRGPFVWFIADCCHSGTLARAGSDEVARQIRPEDFLGSDSAATAITASRGLRPKAEDITHELVEGDFVALYAAQPFEATYEKELPLNSSAAKMHSILTYALVQELEQEHPPASFRELGERIYSRYKSDGRNYPTPFLEGQKDQAILGRDSLAVNLPLAVSRAEGGWRLNAGELRGLTPGTVLAVRGPAGDKIVGHVRLTEIGVQSALAEPCEYAGTPPPSDVPQDNRCEIVFHGVSLRRLKVAIDDLADSGQPVPAEQLAELRKELDALKNENNPLFELVERPPDADWLVRIRGQGLVLVPGSNVPGEKSDDPRIFGPIPHDAVADWLKSRIPRLARAQNLVRLAASAPRTTSSPLKVDLLQFERDAPGANYETLRWSREGLKVKPGTVVGVGVENNTQADVDVCVLLVDSQVGIQELFPQPGNADNRVVRGAYVDARLGTVNDKDKGIYHLLVIAVPSRALASPASFDFLNQPPLGAAPRGDDDEVPAPRGELSPFGQLLLRARTGVRSDDGLPASEVDEATLLLFSWEVS